MNANLLLADLHRLGIRVTASGDRLHVDAPRGAMTDELRQALVTHKRLLLALLAGEQPPNRACYSCDSTRWRQQSPERGGGWLCAACHPDFDTAYRQWAKGR